MNLGQLRATFRTRVDDPAVPPLWTDTELDGYLNEAVAEACVRARLLFDEGSPLCRINVAVNKAIYRLDPSIFEIVDAWFIPATGQPLNGWQLTGASQTSMDQQTDPNRRSQFSSTRDYYRSSYPFFLGGNWRASTGHPRFFIQDQSRFQLAPIPTITGTVNLSVFRVPSCNEVMEDEDDEPVIPAVWHPRLIDWALYRAYSKQDAETLDPTSADKALAMFEVSFGKRTDANVIRKQQQRTRRTTQVAWP